MLLMPMIPTYATSHADIPLEAVPVVDQNPAPPRVVLPLPWEHQTAVMWTRPARLLARKDAIADTIRVIARGILH